MFLAAPVYGFRVVPVPLFLCFCDLLCVCLVLVPFLCVICCVCVSFCCDRGKRGRLSLSSRFFFAGSTAVFPEFWPGVFWMCLVFCCLVVADKRKTQGELFLSSLQVVQSSEHGNFRVPQSYIEPSLAFASSQKVS